MEKKKLTKKEIRGAVVTIMRFETEELLNEIVDGIYDGYSVIVDALSYRGNGSYVRRNSKDRYKYKMIVPILDKYNNLYSTDLHEGGVENAIKGDYGIYRATRQLVIGVIVKIETDYKIERFGFGYRDGNYGIYKLVKKK